MRKLETTANAVCRAIIENVYHCSHEMTCRWSRSLSQHPPTRQRQSNIQARAIAPAKAPPTLPDGWRGIDLSEAQNVGRDGSLAHQLTLIATVHRTIAEHPEVQVVVLPESALGFWTPAVENVWR